MVAVRPTGNGRVAQPSVRRTRLLRSHRRAYQPDKPAVLTGPLVPLDLRICWFLAVDEQQRAIAARADPDFPPVEQRLCRREVLAPVGPDEPGQLVTILTT